MKICNLRLYNLVTSCWSTLYRQFWYIRWWSLASVEHLANPMVLTGACEAQLVTGLHIWRFWTLRLCTLWLLRRGIDALAIAVSVSFTSIWMSCCYSLTCYSVFRFWLFGHIGRHRGRQACGFRIFFFSYQWLSWNQPGPNNIQWEWMQTALGLYCVATGRSMEKTTFGWTSSRFHISISVFLNSEYALPQLGNCMLLFEFTCSCCFVNAQA